MKLKKIFISNYKSIKDEVEIELKSIGNRTCFILLGINESGKSNILDAISLLNPSFKHSYHTDCNREIEAENPNTKILIRYVLENPQIEQYKNDLIAKGIPEELLKLLEIKYIERVVEIDKSDKRDDYFVINIKPLKQFKNYIVTGDTITDATEENTTKDEEGNPNNLLTEETFNELFSKLCLEAFNKSLPEIIYWKPSPNYLISTAIDLNAFKEDQNVSIPLRNCFTIAEISNVRYTIESASKDRSKKVILAEMLSKSVTKHINSIWKDLNIEVQFDIDGMQLEFLVQDKDNTINKLNAQQRSDGFKQFVSILLNLSVETRTIQNKIILLDEPEIHLHPSGQKYLRDELLNIANSNTMIYATHSIYMVDKLHLDRHLSVQKDKGRTSIHYIEKDDPYKEEVLYESLGTSVLEHIYDKVLIFEGKTDRDIFDLYSRKFKKEINLPNITLISADGVCDIIKYTKFFNKKIVKGYALFDSDKQGLVEKNKVLKEPNYNKNNTFEINDIANTKKESTLEDLFEESLTVDVILETFGLQISLDKNKPFMEQTVEHLHSARQRFKEKEKEQFKEAFLKKISKLNKEELTKQKYYQFIKALVVKLS